MSPPKRKPAREGTGPAKAVSRGSDGLNVVRTAEDIQRRLFSTKEAARYLGIGERLMWLLGNRGDIPTVRLGKCLRFDVQDLDAYIQSCKQGGRR